MGWERLSRSFVNWKYKDKRGTVTLIVDFTDLDNSALLADLAVAKDQRRRGFGTALVQVALKKARALGLDYVEATAANTQVAKLFWKAMVKLGWKERRRFGLSLVYNLRAGLADV